MSRHEPVKTPIKKTVPVKTNTMDDITDEDMVQIETLINTFKDKTAVADSPSIQKKSPSVSQAKSFRSLAFYKELSVLATARELKSKLEPQC